jgi:toxin ParE1/3/4
VSRDLVWSHAARHDYLAVLRFIARENPGAASKVADRIDAAAASLGEFATGRAGRASDTYEKVVSGLLYILAYEIVVQPDGGEVAAILHVIHGARDWPAGSWPQD